MNEFNDVSKMKFWCQKVLPLVYDDSLSYYEVLCKVVNKLNETIDLSTNVAQFVEDYFNNLDLQNEVNTKLQELADSGQLAEIIKASYVQPDHHVCILISDSYGVTTDEWQSWETIFSAQSGYTCYAIAVGGSGFIGDTSAENFQQQLVRISSEITDNTSVTDIVVVGGYNDASTSQNVVTLLQAMMAFREEAHSRFPNAEISVGFPAVDYRNNGMQATLNRYAAYYRENCVSLGFTFIEHLQYVLLNKSYIFLDATNTNSGFHPNTAGNQQISNFLCKWFRNRLVDVEYSESFSGISVYTKNGYATIFPTTGYAIPLPAGTYPFNNWLEAVGLSSQSNTIWGTHDAGTCFYGCAPLIQNDGKCLGYMWYRILNKKFEVCNLGNTAGIVVVEGAFLAMGGNTIPFNSNY